MKRCPGCLAFKLAEDFYRNRSQKDGLCNYCKPCWNEYMRPRNHDRIARLRLWETAKERQRIKEWASRDRERYNAAKRAQYGKDIERSRKRARANAMRRRVHKLGVAHEPYRREDIFDRDGWRCGICGSHIRQSQGPHDGLGPSIDHVIPLSLGGPDTPANVQAAHYNCNRRKQARIAA